MRESLKCVFVIPLVYLLVLCSFQANAASEMFSAWWNKNKAEYATHAIWADNVDSVLSGGFFRPAELQLRTFGKVSDEQKWLGSRLETSVHMGAAKAFAEKNPIPKTCDGIAFLRVKQRGPGVDIQIREPNSKDWKTLRSYDGPIERYNSSSKYSYKAMNCDQNLVEALEKEGGISHVEIPIPYCLYLNMEIASGAMAQHLLSITPSPYCYLGANAKSADGENLQQSDAYLKFRKIYEEGAKTLNTTPEALAIIADEMNGGTVDKELAKTINAYSEIAKKAVEAGLPKEHISLSDTDREVTEFFWDLARYGSLSPTSYRHSAKHPQRTISLAYKSIATDYGSVFVLLGKKSVEEFVDSKWLKKLAQYKYPTNEVQTRFNYKDGFAKRDLRNPDIFLLAQRLK